jgi:hypothetical protein
MKRTPTHECPECGRVFNLLDEDDANEYWYGHDCEYDRPLPVSD